MQPGAESLNRVHSGYLIQCHRCQSRRRHRDRDIRIGRIWLRPGPFAKCWPKWFDYLTSTELFIAT